MTRAEDITAASRERAEQVVRECAQRNRPFAKAGTACAECITAALDAATQPSAAVREFIEAAILCRSAMFGGRSLDATQEKRAYRFDTAYAALLKELRL